MKAPKKYRKINILGLIRLEGEYTLKEVLWIMGAGTAIVVSIILLLRVYSIPALGITGVINNAESFIKLFKSRGP